MKQENKDDKKENCKNENKEMTPKKRKGTVKTSTKTATEGRNVK
jgi:hypothetical protein